MKNMVYVSALYGVEHKVFNVGDDGVKKRLHPVFRTMNAFGSSQNVKKNIRDLFLSLTGIERPKTTFVKKATVKDNKIIINEDGKSGEQDGVSSRIDLSNSVCAIFGGWQTDLDNKDKYAKSSATGNIIVSDFLPIHPLLANLGCKEIGVFNGEATDSIALSVELNKKKTILRTPEEAAEFAKCSIEEAREVFRNSRAMNIYEDKETACGLYKMTYALELDKFGKMNLDRIASLVTDEQIEECIREGWREQIIDGYHYLSPSKEMLDFLWENIVRALFKWDFTSNNRIHGSLKEALRYDISFDAQKMNECTAATVYMKDDKMRAKLALRTCDDVYSFNTTLLEKYHICDGSDGNVPIKTSITAEDSAMNLLIQIGKDEIK